MGRRGFVALATLAAALAAPDEHRGAGAAEPRLATDAEAEPLFALVDALAADPLAPAEEIAALVGVPLPRDALYGRGAYPRDGREASIPRDSPLARLGATRFELRRPLFAGATWWLLSLDLDARDAPSPVPMAAVLARYGRPDGIAPATTIPIHPAPLFEATTALSYRRPWGRLVFAVADAAPGRPVRGVTLRDGGGSP